MKRAVQRSFSLCTRNLLLTHPKSISPNLHPSFSPLLAFTHLTLRPYSSDSHSLNEAKLAQQHQNDSLDHAKEASNEELKRLIDKLYEGDNDVMPDIFEAILKRKLSGIPDDEFMKQIPGKRQLNAVDDDHGDGFDADSDVLSGSYSDSDSDEFLGSDDESYVQKHLVD